uniref:HTH CENPB-type domain-containing protein n=1 Tax=Pelusios castaneus TaxID=367368 RepID=A0A8C8RNE1_9SAUR
MSKMKRLAYKIPFKLEVVKYAKEHGNRAAKRHFGPPPTEKMIREWRKQEDQLQKLDKTKHTFLSTKMIIYEAKRIAVEKGIKDFTGSPSWCYRFMRRSGLAMRTKTRIAQKMPQEYESKILIFFSCFPALKTGCVLWSGASYGPKNTVISFIGPTSLGEKQTFALHLRS